jgi:L-rhamnose mutarotase
MQRICFVLQLRPERMQEYKDRHEHVWPEMLAALRETGWHNYSLFLRPDGMLIGYLETLDFSKAKQDMALLEVNELWQREMAPYFLNLPGTAADQAMMPIEEVFHLD